VTGFGTFYETINLLFVMILLNLLDTRIPPSRQQNPIIFRKLNGYNENLQNSNTSRYIKNSAFTPYWYF